VQIRLQKRFIVFTATVAVFAIFAHWYNPDIDGDGLGEGSFVCSICSISEFLYAAVLLIKSHIRARIIDRSQPIRTDPVVDHWLIARRSLDKREWNVYVMHVAGGYPPEHCCEWLHLDQEEFMDVLLSARTKIEQATGKAIRAA